MKNLAGNPISLFLFRFVPRKNAISFVLNEGIAEDLYPETEKQLQPLVHACCETLLRYKHKCRGDTIMDGNILVDGYFEVMLSTGLGKHFVEKEKQNLFNDANKIAKLLMDVMDRRTKEMEQGIYEDPQPPINKIQRVSATSEGLEALGEKKSQEERLQWGSSHFAGLERLKPGDLPKGVMAKRGYDHRGHCIAFVHESLGEIGKIVLSEMGVETLMEADLSKGNGDYLAQKQTLMDEIIAVVEAGLSKIPARKNR